MSDLFNFLIRIAVDPKQQEIFEENPQAIMDTAGLSKAYQTKLRSRTNGQVTAAFREELPTDEFIAVTGACTLISPGTDPEDDPDPQPDSDGDEDSEAESDASDK